MTTIETSRQVASKIDTKLNYELSGESDDSENDIPYHARENALPFTYGNLPRGFKRSDLNHVNVEKVFEAPKVEICKDLVNLSQCPSSKKHDDFEELEAPKNLKGVDILPSSPSTIRKTGRPSISPSRKVLKKTPSREEFEEMLRERKEQSMREQNHALKEAQNASIQKDLDKLQEKLSKRSLQFKLRDMPEDYVKNTCREIVKHVETIDLLDEQDANVSLASTAIVESVSKYDATLTITELKRPETPDFPVYRKSSVNGDRCISPYPMITPDSPVFSPLQRKKNNTEEKRLASKLPSLTSTNNSAQFVQKYSPETPQDVAPHLVKFVRDSSQYWYKPDMTREEAVALLRQAVPGTFIIRKSTTYKNAFGLVMRVSRLPLGLTLAENGESSDILVRHFLLEPTTRGVRLKGCINEPTFTSLSALVYQHSINQLALPCKLIIPNRDLMLSAEDAELGHYKRQFLEQGAACNVLYLYCMNMESLTGDEAIRRAVQEMYFQPELPSSIEVHFKVSQSGITLTDNKRRIFFRRHYAANNISHIAMHPEGQSFTVSLYDNGIERTVNKPLFAFVARPSTGNRDNQCHIFCELVSSQPASAIVSFSHKVLSLNKNDHNML